MRAVVDAWRTMARALPTVADTVVDGIVPWALTPEMYAGATRRSGSSPSSPAAGLPSRSPA